MLSWVQASPMLALQAQDRLLRHFLKRSVYDVRMVPTNGMNYVVIKNKQTAILNAHPGRVQNVKQKKTLVLMHGYGAGLGFFYDNFDDFAEHFDEVIAVDWLGMGCSDRTSQRVSRLNRLDEFVPCTQPKEVREREIAQRVIDEFVDNLEELRKLENLEDFTLAGHSLGGYLAGQYTVKYPKHVNSLVLISPVGVPHAPAKDERMPEQQIDWRLRVIKELWQWNITPQLVVRLAGKRGQNMVLNAIDRRFQSRWSGETAQIMGDYAYNITATPGNGEYCLSALLEPVFTAPTPNSTGRESRVGRSGVYAKLPLEEALCKVPQPILLVYGDNDWLYYPEAAESVRKWQKAEVKTETGETEVRDRAADLLMVPQSGHHLYLENPSFFNSRMLAWLDEVPTKKSS